MRRLGKVLCGVAAAVLVILAPLACVRYEQWQFHNAAGQMLMSTGGYRLIGMGPPATAEEIREMQIARVSGWGAGWFGMFSFRVDGGVEAK